MTFEEIEARGKQTVLSYATAVKPFRQLKERAPGSYRTALLKTELATRVAKADLEVQGLPPLSEDWRLGFLLSEYGKVFLPEAYGENQQGFNILWELHESARGYARIGKGKQPEMFMHEDEHRRLAWYLIRLPATFGPRYVPEGLPGEVVRSMREQYGTYPTFLGPEYRQAGPKPQSPETVLLMLSTLAVAIFATKSLAVFDEAAKAFLAQVELRDADGQFRHKRLRSDAVTAVAVAIVDQFAQLAEVIVKDRDLPIWNALELQS